MSIKALFVIMIGFPMMLSAQSPMDKLFAKYAGQDCFTSVSISKDMFALFSDIEVKGEDTKDFEDFQKMVSQLSGLKILTYSQEGKCGSINFLQELMSVYPIEKYTQLMEVRESDEDVKFYVLKEGNKIPELLMIASEKGEIVALSLTGNIDLSFISKLGKSMHIEGMDNLEKIDEEK
jgi:hypothetical protein